MPTCKDCIHAEVCPDKDNVVRHCYFFKDRSKFIELPDLDEYTTVTTLDEAIDHCFSIANSTDENICAECKAEHLRLCGWLYELKSRVEAEQALKEQSDD